MVTIRYLPEMTGLRRLHLADVAMSSEQAIALADILPEVSMLAHLNLLENPELVRLADAQTEDAREEACALYASLLAAARVSSSLVKIDIDAPSPESCDIVKALANQAIAFFMRNMRGDLEDVEYPDVLRHLVGRVEDTPMIEVDDGTDPAPDEDYVIGGTGVVKALTSVLKNCGDGDRRPTGELVSNKEIETAAPRAQLSSSKAKEMSKHLLANARKIRVRLQPALANAKRSPDDVAKFCKSIPCVCAPCIWLLT